MKKSDEKEELKNQDALSHNTKVRKRKDERICRKSMSNTSLVDKSDKKDKAEKGDEEEEGSPIREVIEDHFDQAMKTPREPEETDTSKPEETKKAVKKTQSGTMIYMIDQP